MQIQKAFRGKKVREELATKKPEAKKLGETKVELDGLVFSVTLLHQEDNGCVQFVGYEPRQRIFLKDLLLKISELPPELQTKPDELGTLIQNIGIRNAAAAAKPAGKKGKPAGPEFEFYLTPNEDVEKAAMRIQTAFRGKKVRETAKQEKAQRTLMTKLEKSLEGYKFEVHVYHEEKAGKLVFLGFDPVKKVYIEDLHVMLSEEDKQNLKIFVKALVQSLEVVKTTKKKGKKGKEQHVFEFKIAETPDMDVIQEASASKIQSAYRKKKRVATVFLTFPQGNIETEVLYEDKSKMILLAFKAPAGLELASKTLKLSLKDLGLPEDKFDKNDFRNRMDILLLSKLQLKDKQIVF